MRWRPSCNPLVLASLCMAVVGYEVPVSDEDYSRQVCSGMWSDDSTYINVTFDSTSRGQLAMVIYEWSDVEYLGKVTSMVDDLPQKTYVCTSDAVRGGFCTNSELGRFILDIPSGKTINQTSFWSARVALDNSSTSTASSISSDEMTSPGSGFWDNPEGNPNPPDGNYTTPWRRSNLDSRQMNPSPSGIWQYTQPIQYNVRKTGYYCVVVVPVTVLPGRRADTDVPFHPPYSGTVLFRNKFEGKLPASDYPKVNFYFALSVVYAALGGVWAWMCYKHREDILPLQYYLSSLVAFLVIEMVANWGYYRYLNKHGRGTTGTVFLFVVAILDAGRNALSFFMLLVVSMGLSVVRESLGRAMLKCQLLAGAHFIFGVLYAVGVVELELESTSALVLLMFVIPLAFTLSGFMLWILYSLNATVVQLARRKQHYKLSMFKRLYYILWFSVLVIGIFFVVSSFSFSARLAEDYAANTWKTRWWLLDGWLSLLYLCDFWAIAYLWRPSENNRRLAMSEELAQDEADAEDYDMDALENRLEGGRVADDDDNMTLVERRGPGSVAEDIVFEIGDEDAGSDDEDDHKKRKPRSGRPSGEGENGHAEERAGLMQEHS